MRRRRKRKITLKRRLQWLGAWSVLIFAVLLTGGIVAGTFVGVRKICDNYMQKKSREAAAAAHMNEKKAQSGGNAEPEKDLQPDKEGGNLQAGEEDISQDGEENQLEEVLILVNKSFYLPTNYEIPLISLDNGQQIAEAMYGDLQNMLMDGARATKSTLLVSSGFRTSEKQGQLLKEEVEKNINAGMGEEEARKDALMTVAPAHYSEHETGLAVDIVSVANQRLDESQEDTAANQWLRENCADYGFILRYPRGKEDVTGFSYESWHFRYVGKAAAEEIMRRGITLEEYLGG